MDLIPDGGEPHKEYQEQNVVDDAITTWLQSSQVVQDPPMTNPEAPNPDLNINKQDACHEFKASIIDFFVGDCNERIQGSASIYDILYGEGTSDIMKLKRGSSMSEQEPQFRWYHLPANNVCDPVNTIDQCNLTLYRWNGLRYSPFSPFKILMRRSKRVRQFGIVPNNRHSC